MTLTTVNDPATAALHWYQQLDAGGRARYDMLVGAVGVDVDGLTGWAQLALAWLAGEDHARLSEALVELFTASHRTDVLDELAAAGMPQLAAALAEAHPTVGEADVLGDLLAAGKLDDVPFGESAGAA